MKSPFTQGVTGLAREAAMDFGHLVGQHVKIAQLELSAEMHALGKRACIVAGLAALIFLGYAFGMAGVAFVLGGHSSVGLPLALIGLVHVVGGGSGLAFVLLRARGSHLMNHTADAMNRGLAALDGVAPSPPVKSSLEQVHAR
jgi:hypothetical protein